MLNLSGGGSFVLYENVSIIKKYTITDNTVVYFDKNNMNNYVMI